MQLYQMFMNMGIAAIVSMLVSALPILAAAMYLFGPTERRLAMMRPLSLAAIFASLSGTSLGAINTLRMLWRDPPPESRILAIASGESLVPLYFGFSCLMIAWLCVAVGMRRSSSQ